MWREVSSANNATRLSGIQSGKTLIQEEQKQTPVALLLLLLIMKSFYLEEKHTDCDSVNRFEEDGKWVHGNHTVPVLPTVGHNI